jgi:hypothetical protein
VNLPTLSSVFHILQYFAEPSCSMSSHRSLSFNSHAFLSLRVLHSLYMSTQLQFLSINLSTNSILFSKIFTFSSIPSSYFLNISQHHICCLTFASIFVFSALCRAPESPVVFYFIC